MKLSNSLFKASRIMRDIEALSSGSPTKIIRRGKNKWVGRHIVRKVFKFPF